MAVVELAIHNTSRVSVNTQTVNLDNGGGYTVHTVIVHYYTDFENQSQELCLTLYGMQSLQGAVSVPFEFSEKGVGK